MLKTILALFCFNDRLLMVLSIYAFSYGIGGVFQQRIFDGSGNIIVFLSQILHWTGKNL